MTKELTVGLIGLDTSHVVAFTKLLNDSSDPHYVPGGKVTLAYPGGSDDFDLSRDRVEGFTNTLRNEHGITIVDSPAAVADACDLVFIESVDGRVHLEQFKQVLPSKKPVFIDKPFTVCSKQANEIMRLADEAGVTVMSCSSLRYSDVFVKAMNESNDDIIGVDVYGPMAIMPTQPGLFWYGIHTVEMLVAAMGLGCKTVHAVKNDDFDLVTCVWEDNRIATIRGNRVGSNPFALTIHRKECMQFVNTKDATEPYYASLLKQIMGNLPQGRSPIDPRETLMVIRLIEAANESRDTGKPVDL